MTNSYNPFVITTAVFLRIVAAISALAALIMFIRASTEAQRSRTAAYYSTRREAMRIATRQLSTTVILVIIAAGTAIVSVVWPPEAAETAALATAAPSPVAQLTLHILPTLTATVARVTGTPALSATPYPTLAVTITSTPGAVASDKLLTLRAISSAVNTNGQPISSTAEFSASVPIVYIFFDYHAAPPGLLMRQTWLHNGESVYSDYATWTLSGSGTTSISWSPKNGFQQGLYEVRIILGGIKQFSANFMVR
jgi:hypothetical protein